MSIVIKAPSGGGSISLDTQQSVTGDHTLQLPTGVGSANQVLRNGSTPGTLEFYTLPVAPTVYELGNGQTWQDVLSSRSAGTVYTNSTGRSIVVNIVTQVNDSGDANYIEVDGVNVCKNHTASSSGANNREQMTMTAIVPNSSTYELSSVGAGIKLWAELR